MRVVWRLQIALQGRNDLLGATFGEVNLRENQAGIGESVFALVEQLDGFGSEVALANQSAVEDRDPKPGGPQLPLLDFDPITKAPEKDLDGSGHCGDRARERFGAR